jgi:hypothetical protein
VAPSFPVVLYYLRWSLGMSFGLVAGWCLASGLIPQAFLTLLACLWFTRPPELLP